jgi:4-oxalomesaconate hydratase
MRQQESIVGVELLEWSSLPCRPVYCEPTEEIQAMHSGLVISAHAADFVWRAGGAIALHAQRGWHVVVVCLSFGERGESGLLWREAGMTLDKVKQTRRKEAEAAAEVLGAEVKFLDLGDYPLRVPDEAMLQVADIIRDVRPEFLLGHSAEDPYNYDHPRAKDVMHEARIIAWQGAGHSPDTPINAPTPIFLYEPHQPEMCNWKPQVYLDIDPVWDTKRKAFECMGAQEFLWDYYTRVALQRGLQASMNGRRQITHAEAYQRIFPMVVEELV